MDAVTEAHPPRENVELKARLPELDRARGLARQLSGGPPETLRQVDTYFRCTHGRLKLREIQGQESQLIAYARADETAPRASAYRIVPTAEAAALRDALADALGVLVVVKKLREISLYKNVRIHLDQVQGLGPFLEFEAVLASVDDQAAGERLVQELAARFELAPAQLIGSSYSDLMLATAE